MTEKSDSEHEDMAGMGATLAWVGASVLAVSCCAFGITTMIAGFASLGALFSGVNQFVIAFIVFIAAILFIIWITRKQKGRLAEIEKGSHIKP